ncbi:Huntingtin interacting protein K [Zea mays]|uniref:Huntingtin interacting protein K n=1 Tax=Zea mays TaxID=4577 RepID=A0A1D6GDV3_MAIZE|nr:Huntingtin interacting protein K [Zea mays]AQK61800.1 Huntingtin interacting protein K [Zea mays]
MFLHALFMVQAMAALASSKEADWNAMRLREKELAAVKINPADVEIIATYPQVHLNITCVQLDKKIAERTLREHKGDAVAAVRFLLR